MLSINAVHGFEYGSGFSGTALRGSEHNDIPLPKSSSEKQFKTITNHAGGILGGISNGMDINFTVGFKPVATIMHNQQTINAAGEAAEIKGKGRHDPCVVPRAVVIVEAMAALVIADHILRNRTARVV
jgi:chorismate synthase